jgi:hypothetical protein
VVIPGVAVDTSSRMCTSLAIVTGGIRWAVHRTPTCKTSGRFLQEIRFLLGRQLFPEDGTLAHNIWFCEPAPRNEAFHLGSENRVAVRTEKTRVLFRRRFRYESRVSKVAGLLFRHASWNIAPSRAYMSAPAILSVFRLKKPTSYRIAHSLFSLFFCFSSIASGSHFLFSLVFSLSPYLYSHFSLNTNLRRNTNRLVHCSNSCQVNLYAMKKTFVRPNTWCVEDENTDIRLIGTKSRERADLVVCQALVPNKYILLPQIEHSSFKTNVVARFSCDTYRIFTMMLIKRLE